MTRRIVLYRPAGSALCLLILSVAGGCAHFHNAELRAQERAGVQHAEPPTAEAEAQPSPAAPPAQLAAVPAAPEPALAAPHPMPAPEVAARSTPVPLLASAAPEEPIAPVAPPEAAAVAAPPAPIPPPANAASLATMPALATDNAIIIFANTPAAHCGTCETLKISVAPSGQVLMERGSWTAGHSDWRYKRSRANVGPDRAAAFAAGLTADRPVGAQTVGSAGCAAPATGDDGLSIEWIEADRHDRLTVKYGCPASSSGETAERLRHAPDLLGLRQLAFP